LNTRPSTAVVVPGMVKAGGTATTNGGTIRKMGTGQSEVSSSFLRVRPLYVFLGALSLVGLEIWITLLRLNHTLVDPTFHSWPEEEIPKNSNTNRRRRRTRRESYPRQHPRDTKKKNNDMTKEPDGFLNGYPIYYHDMRQLTTSSQSVRPTSTNGTNEEPSSRRPSNDENKDTKDNVASTIWSQMHCIGEQFGDLFYHQRKKKHLDLNWMTRSCHFQFLCLDTIEKDFVVFFPPPPPFPSSSSPRPPPPTQESSSSPKQPQPEPEEESDQEPEEQHPQLSTFHHHFASTIFTNASSSLVVAAAAAAARTISATLSSKTTLPLHHKSTVSIGGINSKWGHEGIPKLEWFPRVLHEAPTEFYTLPSHVALIPFHSLAGFNPGHLVWDDFLPIFTLMEIFFGSKFSFDNDTYDDDDDSINNSTNKDTTSSNYNNKITNDHFENSKMKKPMELLMLRYVLPSDVGALWATCDFTTMRQQDCEMMMRKFGPLMVGTSPSSVPIATQHSIRLEFKSTTTNNNMTNTTSRTTIESEEEGKSRYICARHGLAGTGALTDHGTTKLHGWELKDYKSVYNVGRGGQLWRFRNFMLSNLGFLPKSYHHHHDPAMTRMMNAPPAMPFLILFSEASTKTASRNVNFDGFVHALEGSSYLKSQDVEWKRVEMKDYSLIEQAEMVQRTAIYVTVCGGGAVSATFLPRGSSLIVFYDEVGGISNNRKNGAPARLDWDYFNNMAYTRVHWLPQFQFKRGNKDFIQVFLDLVEHEIELMTIQRQEWEWNNEEDE